MITATVNLKLDNLDVTNAFAYPGQTLEVILSCPDDDDDERGHLILPALIQSTQLQGDKVLATCSLNLRLEVAP